LNLEGRLVREEGSRKQTSEIDRVDGEFLACRFQVDFERLVEGFMSITISLDNTQRSGTTDSYLLQCLSGDMGDHLRILVVKTFLLQNLDERRHGLVEGVV
jgi:hypothetical protein